MSDYSYQLSFLERINNRLEEINRMISYLSDDKECTHFWIKVKDISNKDGSFSYVFICPSCGKIEKIVLPLD